MLADCPPQTVGLCHWPACLVTGQEHTLKSRGFVICDGILRPFQVLFHGCLVFFPVCFPMWTVESAFPVPGVRERGPLGILFRVRLHL